MGRLNLDPIMMFSDGSQLLVSTQHSREGSFICKVLLASQGHEDRLNFRVMSDHLEASTCLEAQDIAFRSAQRMYPGTADMIKKPPYLIWVGPTPNISI